MGKDRKVVAGRDQVHHFPVANRGHAPDLFAYHREPGHGYAEVRQAVGKMGVRAAVSDDDLRAELVDDRFDHRFESQPIGVVSRPGRHGKVHRIAQALSITRLLYEAGPDKKHLLVAVEVLAGPVAGMGVRIEHQHAIQAEPRGEVGGAEGDVVIDAKTLAV